MCVCVCMCGWMRVKEQTMKRKLGGEVEMMEKRSGEMLRGGKKGNRL